MILWVYVCVYVCDEGVRVFAYMHVMWLCLYVYVYVYDVCVFVFVFVMLCVHCIHCVWMFVYVFNEIMYVCVCRGISIRKRPCACVDGSWRRCSVGFVLQKGRAHRLISTSLKRSSSSHTTIMYVLSVTQTHHTTLHKLLSLSSWLTYMCAVILWWITHRFPHTVLILNPQYNNKNTINQRVTPLQSDWTSRI